jgi:phosphohistidine phosphatase SixA/ADP-ribose pyrophosphatase YjhB (NUDIX family)
VILYFVRHGNAGDGSMGADDDQRQLTTAGVEALRAAALLWRRLNLRPDVVLTSPLPRSLQTAELLVAGLGLREPPVVDERLRPGAAWGDLARAMAAHPQARRLMYVGHEPDLSRAVGLLTGAGSVRMRKGSVACVEFPGVPEPGAGELAWLIDPDLYTVPAEGAPTLVRVAAYGIVLDEADRLLLCRLSEGEVKPGWWTLPGGGLDFGEDPRDAVLRELTEETGLTGEVISLAGVESYARAGATDRAGPLRFQAIQIIYRIRLTGGTLRDEADGSTDRVAWFSRAELAGIPMVGLAKVAARLAFA